MPAALAGSMVVAFLHQLLRRDGRPRLVESVASVITGARPDRLRGLPRAAAADGRAGARSWRWPGPPSPSAPWSTCWPASAGCVPWLLPLALVAGTAAAVGVSAVAGGVSLGAAAVLGLGVAAVSAALRAVLGALPTMSGPRSQLACASASVLGCGVVVYVVGRLARRLSPAQ